MSDEWLPPRRENSFRIWSAGTWHRFWISGMRPVGRRFGFLECAWLDTALDFLDSRRGKSSEQKCYRRHVPWSPHPKFPKRCQVLALQILNGSLPRHFLLANRARRPVAAAGRFAAAGPPPKTKVPA